MSHGSKCFMVNIYKKKNNMIRIKLKDQFGFRKTEEIGAPLLAIILLMAKRMQLEAAIIVNEENVFNCED